MKKLPFACDSAGDWSETSVYELLLVRQPSNKYKHLMIKLINKGTER